MSGDTINLTVTEDVLEVTIVLAEDPAITVEFSEIALPDPSVAEAKNAAIAAQAAAEAAADAAEQAALDAAGIVAGIEDFVAEEIDIQVSALTTDDIAQGVTNKYYSDLLFGASLLGSTTDSLPQGVINKYYSGTLFNASFALKTTEDLAELTNLYWTETRFNTSFGAKRTADLTESINLYFTDARAKAAAVLNTTAGSQTDQAPSVAAMKSYVTANAGGSGGSLSWEKIGDIAPTNESQDGIKLEAFDYQDEQEIYLTLNVPDNYVAGNQIKLKNGAFFLGVNTNKVLFRTVTTLIRPGSTVLGTYSNTYTSTNLEVSANGTINTLTAIGDLDLSNSSGQINSVAIAAGDKLRVKLSRKVASESASAADKAKLMINNFDVTFR